MKNSVGGMAAVSMLTNPASVVALIAPVVVNALVAGGRIPLSSASAIGASELGGMTMALLLGPTYVGATRRRMLALLAIVVAAAAHVSSLYVEGVGALAMAHAVAGASEGVLYAVAVAALATSAAPDRAFGIMITINHAASSALIALISWIALRAALAGTVFVVAISVLIVAPFVAFLPVPSRRTANGSGASASDPRRWTLALTGVSGVLLLSGGFGVVWPLMGHIGLARELTPGAVASGLSFGGIGGIVGGLVAAMVGIRFGRTAPILAGSAAFAVALAIPTYSMPFGVVAFAITFFWTWCLPYYLGWVSHFDRTGRVTVFTTAMIPCGIAAGQAGAGFATASWSLAAITVVGGAAVLLAGVAIVLGARALTDSPAHSIAGALNAD